MTLCPDCKTEMRKLEPMNNYLCDRCGMGVVHHVYEGKPSFYTGHKVPVDYMLDPHDQSGRS
jgi:predicted amidophosphoribosyltransferase